MNRTRNFLMAVLAGVAVTTTALPSNADDMSSAPTARFSKTAAYTGNPALPTTLSMIIAGGGPSDFDTVKLLTVLAGDKTSAEVASLTKKFGADNVKSFITVFNFVVSDSLVKVKAAGVALPTTPNPSPTDGKALAAALYKLGLMSNGSYNVEYMLDNLVSHPIHVAVMDDIDKKYGREADGNYHAVLTQAMLDLKSVYGL
jgi:hypothetical protein